MSYSISQQIVAACSTLAQSLTSSETVSAQEVSSLNVISVPADESFVTVPLQGGDRVRAFAAKIDDNTPGRLKMYVNGSTAQGLPVDPHLAFVGSKGTDSDGIAVTQLQLQNCGDTEVRCIYQISCEVD